MKTFTAKKSDKPPRPALFVRDVAGQFNLPIQEHPALDFSFLISIVSVFAALCLFAFTAGH